jgi:hypothetical protein
MHQRSTRWALVGVFLALPAAATIVIAQTYEEMARTSPLIVRATVGQTQSAWNEQHTTIETFNELLVTDVLKGRAARGATLMVRTPGGIVGKIGARVEGSPKFQTGEDTLLFLEPAADTTGIWLVSGMAAGKITFAKTPYGEVRAVRDVRGLGFYDTSEGAPKFQRIDRAEDLGTLDAFMSRIRQAVGR